MNLLRDAFRGEIALLNENGYNLDFFNMQENGKMYPNVSFLIHADLLLSIWSIIVFYSFEFQLFYPSSSEITCTPLSFSVSYLSASFFFYPSAIHDRFSLFHQNLH